MNMLCKTLLLTGTTGRLATTLVEANGGPLNKQEIFHARFLVLQGYCANVRIYIVF